MDANKILNNFPSDLRNRFLEVSEKLDDDAIGNESEKEVSALILDLMDRVNLDENSIMKTSYLIANAFKEFSFDERIQRAIEIFCELQIPVDFHEGREFELWEKARDYLIKFLDDEKLEEDSNIEEIDLDLD